MAAGNKIFSFRLSSFPRDRFRRYNAQAMRYALFVLALLMASVAVAAQGDASLNKDPKNVKFVTSDIANFWRAYDLAEKETDRAKKVAIFQTEYIDKGSDGLRDFVQLRIGSADKLVARITKMPKFYAAARQPTLAVAGMERRLRSNFERFKRLYPDAVFPDVYFVIGVASSGGTTGNSGLLIGSEMYSLTDDTPTDELSAWLKSVLAPVKNVPAIVAHESCHYNQKYEGDKNLLAKAIQEGSCDFIGELLSGGNINDRLKKYADPRQSELWAEFSSQMAGKDISKWLFNGTNATDRPADLGYYFGYKISESYYRRAKDKRQAVRDILNIMDSESFLKTSGYAPRAPSPATQ
jgi:predicted Zn-dependent protease DUF2268